MTIRMQWGDISDGGVQDHLIIDIDGASVILKPDEVDLLRTFLKKKTPVPQFKEGDRILRSGGMGDYDTGTVLGHTGAMYQVLVDKNPGDKNSGTCTEWWNQTYVHALHEED